MLGVEALMNYINGGGDHGHDRSDADADELASGRSSCSLRPLQLRPKGPSLDGLSLGPSTPAGGGKSPRPPGEGVALLAHDADGAAAEAGEGGNGLAAAARTATSVRSLKTASIAVARDLFLKAFLSANPSAVPPFPVTFSLVVGIDSALDGLLVGVAMVTGARTGLIMVSQRVSQPGPPSRKKTACSGLPSAPAPC